MVNQGVLITTSVAVSLPATVTRVSLVRWKGVPAFVAFKVSAPVLLMNTLPDVVAVKLPAAIERLSLPVPFPKLPAADDSVNALAEMRDGIALVMDPVPFVVSVIVGAVILAPITIPALLEVVDKLIEVVRESGACTMMLELSVSATERFFISTIFFFACTSCRLL